MENLSGFILAAFALVGSPGPATLSLAATGAAFGARRGIGYLIGIEVGMVLIMVITASGVMGLLVAAPMAAPIVMGLGAAYILYLAYRIATAPVQNQDHQTGQAPTFMGGLLLSLVNPKAYASLAALYSGFVLVANDFQDDAVLKGLVLVVILTTVDLVWLGVGARLNQWIQNPQKNRIVNRVFAVLLIISVGFAVIR